MDKLIGSEITLISNKDIRYVGILEKINQEDSSIILKQVKSYGTEDRVDDPALKYGPSENLIAFVQFPGTAIKAIEVTENDGDENDDEEESKQKKHQQQVDTKKKEDNNNNANNTKNYRQSSNNQNRSNNYRNKNDGPKHKVGSGAHLVKMRTRGGDGVTIMEGEFDFEKGLSVFNKDEPETEEAVEVEAAYSKDSFFDTLSSDALDRAEGRRTRMTGREERSMNLDTFGATSLQSNRYYHGRGRGRGRGRGGRGRGRGRGYGNYGRGSGYNRNRNRDD